jgi:serine/threonine protein kinase
VEQEDEQRYQKWIGLDEFEPIRVLDQGRFGVLFRVRHRDHGYTRVLKVRAEGPERLAACQRLEREAQVLPNFRHKHVVRLHEVLFVPVGPCLVLEDLGDQALDELPELEGRPEEVVPLMLQVAEALEFLHAGGLVHKDVKPANIMRTPDQRAVLVDFGGCIHPDLPRWTEPGMVAGTLPYMAPEVYRGELIGPASDWFSWGLSLYRILEGDLPFGETSYEDAVVDGQIPEIPMEEVDPDSPVGAAILACLEPDPARRPASLAEIRHLLGQPVGLFTRLKAWWRGF